MLCFTCRVSADKPYTCLTKTQISTSRGSSDASAAASETVQKISINFHVSKISDLDKKLHTLCLVLQPIVVVKNN